MEKQEMRVKKKNPGYAIVGKNRSFTKFTMEDLAAAINEAENEMRE